MAHRTPQELAESLLYTDSGTLALDIDAVRDEAASEDVSDLVDELVTSFKIEFQENHNHIQGDILDAEFTSLLESASMRLETLTKDDLQREAENRVQDVLHEYVTMALDEMGEDATGLSHNIPDAGEIEFSDTVLAGFWEDVEEYKETASELDEIAEELDESVGEFSEVDGR